jgi:hypothetical protein
MKFISRNKPILLCLLAGALLVAPIALAHVSGGSVTGTVTDPKGAVIAGATVKLAKVGGGAPITAQTNAQGKFKIEGLAPGAYVVSITAPGFDEVKRENVLVDEGKAAEVSAQLVITPISADVNVGAKPGADRIYQQLRQASTAAGGFSSEYATVKNLVLQRDAGTFTLRSGEIYFLAPVEGRTVGAVFLGDGVFELNPPTEAERNSLAIFTDTPGINEGFNQLVLRFTDQTFDEIKRSPNATMQSGGPQVARARSAYQDRESSWRKTLELNLDLRALMDIYATPRPGFFYAFINGNRFNKLYYRMDPQGIGEVYPEEVALGSYGDSDQGIWAAFHLANEHRNGTANGNEDHRIYDINRHTMDVTIRGTRLTTIDVMELAPVLAGQRVLPFDFYGSLRVTKVQDESGRNFDFVQEDKDQDATLGVILPQPAEAGKPFKLKIEYSGEGALKDSGAGNFYLGPRATWYPNNGYSAFGDRAAFDLTFHYPKAYILVGVGALVEPESLDGETKNAHWTSGLVELAVAGFNYGKFKKKDVIEKDTGLTLEFYANAEPPDEFKDFQMQVEEAKKRYGVLVQMTVDSFSPPAMASAALADTQNSVRLYSLYFGKLPYTRVAMTQQPQGFFGQAWPTLVFMPYLAFIDESQRVQIFGARGGTDSFWTYVGPHEVSHQWWGHAVGWTNYRDQWMSEGFAEFSTSLYAQYIRKDINKFIAFWDEQRTKIIQATEYTKGKKPYTVGPISQGYRLSNPKTGGVYNALVYPKGAYVLHMIRMMMFDPRNGGDKRFIEMMHEFVGSHMNQDVSTIDFQRAVEKYMTPNMDVGRNKTMDWFFHEWVDGTDVPDYRFDYQMGTNAEGKPTISGRITQSGVSPGFAMSVPVYLDFGSGWVRLGSITLVGNSSFELPAVTLAQAPKRVTLCALDDVLYTNLQVNKH